MSDEQPTPERSRWRDFWQLHVPLVVVLIICAIATVIEVRRAGEGFWRAWFYMVEWPLIGVVAVWIWHRYRTEGSVTAGMVARWKARAEAAARQEEHDTGLQAWNAYVDDLEKRQPPGGPPNAD